MKKRVIYTAIFGDKDALQDPEFTPKGIDFVCFADSDFESNAWDVRKEPSTEKTPRLDAKKFKILPHTFLQEYDESIWIDGNMVVRGDANELFDTYLRDVNIAMYDHAKTKMDKRDSVKKEAEALIDMAHKGKFKDHPEVIRDQIARYRQEGFPDDNGLISGMIILRRHNEPNIVRAMEAWWDEINKHSHRDQLSFNYVAWKNDLDFVYIQDDSRDNPYFLWTPHQK